MNHINHWIAIHEIYHINHSVFVITHTHTHTHAGLPTTTRYAAPNPTRLDKYYSLIRKQIHEVFVYLRTVKWNATIVEQWSDVLYAEVVDQKPNGLRCHIMDVYLAELSKASGVTISDDSFQLAMEPFYRSITFSRDRCAYQRLQDTIFEPLAHGAVLLSELGAAADESETEGVVSFRLVSLASVADRIHAAAALR